MTRVASPWTEDQIMPELLRDITWRNLKRKSAAKLGSRPRARGLAWRDVRRFDHVTLMRGAAALAVATNTLAVLLRESRLQPHSALGNPCQVVAVTLSPSI